MVETREEVVLLWLQGLHVLLIGSAQLRCDERLGNGALLDGTLDCHRALWVVDGKLMEPAIENETMKYHAKLGC